MIRTPLTTEFGALLIEYYIDGLSGVDCVDEMAQAEESAQRQFDQLNRYAPSLLRVLEIAAASQPEELASFMDYVNRGFATELLFPDVGPVAQATFRVLALWDRNPFIRIGEQLKAIEKQFAV